jgi:short-subunit dehydrogenase
VSTGLINNAGRSYAVSIEEIEPALFDEIFHLNVLGPIVAMEAVIPVMRFQGGGSIVNINSGTAFMTVPQYSVYSSSKRALLGFSLAARAELEKDRIVVSEIYPFITATNFGTNRMGNPAAGGPAAQLRRWRQARVCRESHFASIGEGHAQYFANDRLGKMAGVA